MQDQNHLRDMQRYIADVAITASALRNQGGAGLVSAARQFLADLDLEPLVSLDTSEYPKDRWGSARKSINIFMTMASLNRFLRRAHALKRLQDVLEVPLDNVVEGKLRRFGRKHKLFAKKEFPKWKSIKTLDPMNSEKYQQIAKTMAKELGIPRGRLDVELACSERVMTNVWPSGRANRK